MSSIFIVTGLYTESEMRRSGDRGGLIDNFSPEDPDRLNPALAVEQIIVVVKVLAVTFVSSLV